MNFRHLLSGDTIVSIVKMGVASSLLDPKILGWLISEDIYHSFNIDKQADGYMKSLIGWRL